MLKSRSVLIAIAFMFVGCSHFRSTTAPLETTLGRDRINTVSDAVISDYLASRKPVEAPIEVYSSFWSEVRPKIYRTMGPLEEAEEFLRSGFRAFLSALENFLLDEEPDRKEIPFDGYQVVRYVGQSRCVGSPCPVPPCCGDRLRCWQCQVQPRP